jgi:hypothetical protein
MKRLLIMLLVLGSLAGMVQAKEDLAKNFAAPPDSARPWVYWFWLNGNITREGITADLEAMKRVGIGGALIMEVDQGTPKGPVAFMSGEWRALFKFGVSEAQRLGLEVNMNNDAGWNGSGGPWIKPAESMQKVVWSETSVEGAKHFDGNLPQPETVEGFYREIAVLAMPTPGAFRIESIQAKAGYGIDSNLKAPATNVVPPEMVIERGRIVDLTSKMDKDGKLVWDPPAGKWTVMRFGHTSTGAKTLPAPDTGHGLECDKLSKEGSEAAFNGMMAKLIADVGPLAGKSLVATHVDSWENGAQNWTARMREEFQKRRGYDLLPFLPAMSGRVVQSLEVSERFLGDLRQTIADLIVDNYAGHLRDLARKNGMRFSIEAYGGPTDSVTDSGVYAGRADEPMAEFWVDGGMFHTCKAMSSAAHTYGKPVVGAEAFTAGDPERFLLHPATIKAIGDRAMCLGVNRFVFHRYAMQPWLNPKPGMMMGPWGVHYERTQTWWEQTKPWHEYLARCHYLLRQGLFVADICYLPGGDPNSRNGYDFDNCTSEVILTRMQVKDGRLVLPDGMSYRVLALQNMETMTPQLLRKIKELADAGAKIVGPAPNRSPSLTGYPQCDAEVKKLAAEMWANGKIVTHKSPEQVLAEMGVPPDFKSKARLNYIHRVAGDTDIYFVANPQPRPVKTVAEFRSPGRQPEFWRPETGLTERAAVFHERDGVVHVALSLQPSESVFVMFRKSGEKVDPVVSVTHDGQPVLPVAAAAGKVTVTKALYGVLNDPARTRDVRNAVQQRLDAGELEFQVAQMAAGGDPASGVVKTLAIEYTTGGKQLTASATDPDIIVLTAFDLAEPQAEIRRNARGQLVLGAWQPGHYEIKTESGHSHGCDVPTLPKVLEIGKQWQVKFDPKGGGPAEAAFDKLEDWSKRHEDGIKYYSGTAAYRTTFTLAGAPKQGTCVFLDLGKVAVMAEVSLNGKNLGVLWKPPYRVDATQAIKAGSNTLEIKVTNLPINRMIGDEFLPEDSERHENGTLMKWPQWLLDGKPSPTGRFTFASWRLWKKDQPLQESGLLGPVTVRTGAWVDLN